MFNLAVELTLNTLKQTHKLVSENWVLLSTKYKISIQITLLLSHIARMITIPEWGANIFFPQAQNGHDFLSNSLSGRAETGENLFSCFTVNPNKLHLLEQN